MTETSLEKFLDNYDRMSKSFASLLPADEDQESYCATEMAEEVWHTERRLQSLKPFMREINVYLLELRADLKRPG